MSCITTEVCRVVATEVCRVVATEVCRVVATEVYRVVATEICRVVATEVYRVVATEVCRVVATEVYRVVATEVCRVVATEVCRVVATEVCRVVATEVYRVVATEVCRVVAIYRNLFNRLPKHRLTTDEHRALPGVSVELCARNCVVESAFKCNGFNYETAARKCFLLEQTPSDSNGVIRSPDTDFYERGPGRYIYPYVQL